MMETTLQTLSIMRCWKTKMSWINMHFHAWNSALWRKWQQGLHGRCTYTQTQLICMQQACTQTDTCLMHLSSTWTVDMWISSLAPATFLGEIFTIGATPGSQVCGRGCPAFSAHSQHCLGHNPHPQLVLQHHRWRFITTCLTNWAVGPTGESLKKATEVSQGKRPSHSLTTLPGVEFRGS